MKITNMKNLKESPNVNSELDIDEQVRGTNILSQIGGAKNFKGLSKTLQAAFKDMEVAIGLQKNPIMLGSKELKTTDDIFLALKDGSLVKNAKELGRVEKGLLKSVNTDPALRKAIAVDFASDKTILAQFAKENKTNAKEIKEFLKSKGYPDSSINEIIAQMKKNGNMDPKGLFTVKGSSKVTPPPPPPVPKSLLSRTKELLDNIKIKKMSWKQLLAWGAGIGIGAVALWVYIKNNIDETPEGMPETQPKDNTNNEWGECLNDIIKSNDGRLTTTNRGSSVVLVNPTDKYPKGLVFYSNNRVQNLETKDMGTWSCKGSTAVIAESVNDVVKRVLKEKLLNEQITDTLMDGYVDTAVDDLDGYVAEYNLKSLKNILLKLKGKTYNGKDAISEFLRYYSADERGDDFISDVESVGVANLSVAAKNMKEEIIKIASGGSNVPDVPNVQNSKKVTINEQSSIDISWDKDKKIDGGGTVKKKSSYRDCEGEEFPLAYGCKSTKIAEVQKCLGVAADGKLGPKTMKAIADNKYDTSRGLSKDVYDAIKTNCVPVEKRREKIDPINLPVKGLDMSSLAPNSIKIPDLSKMIQMNPQPADLYQVLMDAGYITGDSRSTVLDDGTTIPATKRVKYKGPDLEEDVLGKLDGIMLGMGYDRIKQKLDKRYGAKYVWLQK